MSAEESVRQASDQFYAALNQMANGDSSAMADIWAHNDWVTTQHPIGGREVGWDAISNSFANVAQIASNGSIEMRDQRIQVAGDLAYEIGVEAGSFEMAGHHADIEHRVTNIYQRQGDAWKLVHHHTDTSPVMLEILSKL